MVDFHNRWNPAMYSAKQAIAAGRVPDFKTLTHTTSAQFYNHDSGVHYAQARYLCYYLQQKGLLRIFYKRLAAHVADDPTGYRTLGEVLAVKGLFPSTHPEVDNGLEPGTPFSWLGWDWIEKTDIAAAITQCEALFDEGREGR